MALLLTLVGVAALTVVLSLAQTRLLEQRRFGVHVVDAAERAAQAEAAVVFAAALLAADAGPPPVRAALLDLDGVALRVVLRDVAGLIDLNAADPALVERAFGPDAAAEILAVRAGGARLHAPSDVFARDAPPPEAVDAVLRWTTTASERSGVALSAAPEGLKERLGGARFRPDWELRPSGDAFRVEWRREDDAVWRIAAVLRRDGDRVRRVGGL